MASKKARAWRRKALKHYHEGMTDPEIAKACGVPVNAVRDLRFVHSLVSNGMGTFERKVNIQLAWELFRKGTHPIYAAEKLGCSRGRVQHLYAHMRNS